MSRPKTGSVCPNGTWFSQRSSGSHSSPPAMPKRDGGMSRSHMTGRVVVRAPRRRRSVSTTTRGTCGRSAKYRFGSARTKKMPEKARNAQNAAVKRRRYTSSSPRLRNQSRSVRKPTSGPANSGRRSRRTTTTEMTITRRDGPLTLPPRPKPARSRLDQSRRPESRPDRRAASRADRRAERGSSTSAADARPNASPDRDTKPQRAFDQWSRKRPGGRGLRRGVRHDRAADPLRDDERRERHLLRVAR